MDLNNILNSIYQFLLKCCKYLDISKFYIYIYLFAAYFLLNYSITLTQALKNKDGNFLYDTSQTLSDNYIVIIVVSSIFLLALIGGSVYYGFIAYNINKPLSLKTNIAIILPTIFSIAILTYINVLTFNEDFSIIGESYISKYILTIITTILNVFLILLFIYNIDTIDNVEFYIALSILLLYFIDNVIFCTSEVNKIYNDLKNSKYATLSINCINESCSFENNENFANNNSNTINSHSQLQNIYDKYGNNYLKLSGNIPVSYLSKKTNTYEDLILSDFYYPGSYYSYLADSPLNGTPSLDALKIVLSQFKARIIHLDIYSDKKSEYDPDGKPIVKCENMSNGSLPLDLLECFGIISKWAWNQDDPNNSSYPLFLYLKLNFNEHNESLYIKIYDMIIKVFSKYFIDKKYGYAGRNGAFPISMATMKECLGKIIIITDKYPTRTILDEFINGTTNNLNENFNLLEYKPSYITYDKIGLAQDNDRNKLVSDSKTTINFYYTLPNKDKKNNSQEKAGLYNPSFQDCAQYGIQGTLMYLFIPDENLNKWNLFFKNTNNYNPVLKDELLRYLGEKKIEIKPQPKVLGLQKPQKVCLGVAGMTTEASNFSDSSTNPSC